MNKSVKLYRVCLLLHTIQEAFQGVFIIRDVGGSVALLILTIVAVVRKLVFISMKDCVIWMLSKVHNCFCL